MIREDYIRLFEVEKKTMNGIKVNVAKKYTSSERLGSVECDARRVFRR